MTETPDYGDHATTDVDPGSNELVKLASLADDQQRAEAEVARLEAELKKAKENLTRISEGLLPELMDELGMEHFKTTSGIEIAIEEKIHASIPKARNAEAIAWLDDNEHSGSVKRQFVIRFNRDEQAWANRFAADLRKRKKKVDAEMNHSIHPSTLRALMKELLERGDDVPLELFGIHRRRVSKIK